MQAIFLDRDGVINRERADYVKSWDEFEFLPGVLPALQRIAALQLPICIITNQSAIGRGIITAADVDEIHRYMQREIVNAGGYVTDFFVCPHHPDDDCTCRKPKPGLLVRAASQLNVDLPQCVFIGDSITDFGAAKAAGCQSILVTTGRQGEVIEQEFTSMTEVSIVPNLGVALDQIALA